MTQSAVTAPANGAATFFDNDLPAGAPSNARTIAGTSNGVAGETVDIGCQYTYAGTPKWGSVANDVPVGANGSFSISGVTSGLLSACTLRAIPGATPDPARATLAVGSFAGPLVLPSYKYSDLTGGAVGNFTIRHSQVKGYAYYSSAGSCGVTDANVITGAAVSDELFYCNDYFHDTFNANRGMVVIDGKRAKLAADQDLNKPGAKTLTFSRSVDPVTQDLTIRESEQAVRCSEPVASCASYLPVGVRLDRVITQDHEGLQITVRDSWVATDGAAHSLDLLEQEDFETTTGLNAFAFPWESAAFSRHDVGDVADFPGDAPATVLVDGDDTLADNSPHSAQGAITYASAPKALAFTSDDSYVVRYLKQIPAGGAAQIVQVYSQAIDRPTVNALAAEAVKSHTPPPAPTPPATTPPSTVVERIVERRVTVPTPQCVVPKLKGLTLAKAKAALKKARCATGKTSNRRTTKTRPGRVIGASKQTGGAWKAGQKINLTIATKPRTTRR